MAGEGKSFLTFENIAAATTISLIILGDWVSYYLALAYKKDPIQIKNIDYLKSELTKI